MISQDQQQQLASLLGDFIAFDQQPGTAINCTITTNQPLNAYSNQPGGYEVGPPSTFSKGILVSNITTAFIQGLYSSGHERFWSTRTYPSDQIGTELPFSPQSSDTDFVGLRVNVISNYNVNIKYSRFSNGTTAYFDMDILGFYRGLGGNGLLLYGTYGDFNGFITVSIWEGPAAQNPS